MKIVWITIDSILPADSGGRIGIFKRLEQLSKDNEIYLFYTMDNESDKKYIKSLERYCKEVHGYLRQKKSVETIGNCLKAPFTVASRKNTQLIKDCQECLDKNNIDVINVDSPHMGLNIMSLKTDVPIVLNQHNIEWQVYRNISKASSNYIKKIVYLFDSFRFKTFEKKLYKKTHFELVTFVSQDDMKYFSSTEKNYGKLALVPVGAASHPCRYNWESDGKNNKIIFVGKMSYAPNAEAVKWFANNIFSKILEAMPDAEFWIVGKDPTAEVLQLKNHKNIHVTGSVDEVKSYYETADLVVIPLNHGGGVKVKLLEAMGFKVPIVSTTVGIQGTEFTNKDLLVADEEIVFAEKCIEFLKNKKSYKKMYEDLFKRFDNGYTWEAIGKKYKILLTEASGKEI